MKTVTGKYGNAVIYTDLVDEKSLEQVRELLDQPFAEGQKIRMMPDIHAGAGCVIGTTMTITNKICPNLVGVDIGCVFRVFWISVIFQIAAFHSPFTIFVSYPISWTLTSIANLFFFLYYNRQLEQKYE